LSDGNPFQDTAILITREGMGSGPVELQRKLLDTYLRLLEENRAVPSAVCFYTDGVKLVTQGSLLLERLRALEQRGARLIVCSTCLTYFQLTDKVEVGIVGGMADILEAQAKASKVLTL
jgi:intracellular sulfur oxidation DsrE/DsrF family protein